MTPEKAQQVLLDIAHDRGRRDAIATGAPTLENRMKRLQRHAGGGTVTLSLGITGDYHAHVYPSPKQASEQVRARTGKADLAGIREAQDRPLASGKGKTIEAAMTMLIKNVGVPA